VTLLADTAIEAVGAAESAVMGGGALGPLQRVPFTVKDALDTAGIATMRCRRAGSSVAAHMMNRSRMSAPICCFKIGSQNRTIRTHAG
jgi:Asp-tRNA(Asn)/Glu-tRNA(Gln) amidotransferase A subunit family amidase